MSTKTTAPVFSVMKRLGAINNVVTILIIADPPNLTNGINCKDNEKENGQEI